MPYRDLRDFITALERNNELKTVKGADWDLERRGGAVERCLGGDVQRDR